MKRKLLALIGFIALLSPALVYAQTATFTVPMDTVAATILKTGGPADNITNITGSNLSLSWHVTTATDFPDDWLTPLAFGICDNSLCRGNGFDMALWNDTTHTATTYTSIYGGNAAHDSTGGFSLSLDLSSAVTLGTHHVTINITDASSGYNKNVVFVISKLVSTVGVNSIANNTSDILLYPNPAHDELNVVYDPNADVKSIAVYNIIGKVLSVYKVNGSSANLNLENIPSGIYFVRLYNSDGHVVVTKKFTKQ